MLHGRLAPGVGIGYSARDTGGTMRRLLTVAALFAELFSLGLVGGGSPARAQDELPIFDTHLHYSSDGWGSYSVDTILDLMAQAGVYRALVSSTPDDGTLALFERAPDRVVPVLRPYRTRGDMATWTTDPTVVSYVEERLARGVYRGIGEFHLYAGQAANLAPRRIADMAADQDLVLHAHADAGAVAELLALRSDVKVLWAHAGMSDTPATVGTLLDRHPNLRVELALRTDVAPRGTLDPAWEAVFLRHPDRFMIGTDTWIASRWPQLPRLMAEVRAWLRQLPRDVAERIASRNAEALFGPAR